MTAASDLQKQFDEARALIEKYERILLFSHEYTDGDDLGGTLALAAILRKKGKRADVAAKGGVPDSLLFLPGHSEVLDNLPTDFEKNYDLVIMLGCGSIDRVGFGEVSRWQGPILNIDHHHKSEPFGTVNVLDETMAANCELLYTMFLHWGAVIDKTIALCLLTGIFTDTGGFRHSNVQARTLAAAAELLRRGAKIDLIARFTFSQKDLPKLRAWAQALENARLDKSRGIVYTIITEDDLRKADADEQDLEGVVELLNTIPDARYAMMLKQRGEEVKGSLRSEPHKGVDVSEIARTYGGGGHKLAAGFKFKGKIERTEDGWRIT